LNNSETKITLILSFCLVAVLQRVKLLFVCFQGSLPLLFGRIRWQGKSVLSITHGATHVLPDHHHDSGTQCQCCSLHIGWLQGEGHVHIE